MKKLIIVLIILTLQSCTSQKSHVNKNSNDLGIPYILPGAVQKLLVENIANKKDSVYFLIGKVDSESYEISVLEYINSTPYIKWINNTNRFIYLKGEFYPVIFDFDALFSTQMTVKEFKERVLPDGSFKIDKINGFDEHPYRIRFNIRGKIFYHGYE